MNTITLPVITTPPVPGKSINCLRCRHAKLLPHSSFEYENVPMHCKKLKRNMPLRYDPCPYGDPRRYIVAKYRVRNPKTHGDFLKEISGPERLFLRRFYPTAPIEFLERATGRKRTSLRSLCTSAGIYRSEAAKVRGRQWPHQQRSYVSMCINNGFWPKRGHGSKTPRAMEIKAEIVRRVNELGPERTWLQIRLYAKSLTPAYVAREPRKKAGHVEWKERRRAERLASMTDEQRADFLRRSEYLRRSFEERTGTIYEQQQKFMQGVAR
jgi:hypothetical protein